MLAGRGIEVDPEVVLRHMEGHRPLQAPVEGRVVAADCLAECEQMSERRQQILLLLARCPGMSADQISALLYENGNRDAALRSALRDLRQLLYSGMAYRLFVEQVTGGGPRRRRGIPALFFPGRRAKAWIGKQTGQKRGRGYRQSPADWKDWREPFEDWRRAEAAALFYRQMPVLEGVLRQVRLGENILSVHPGALESMPRAGLRFDDPLQGKTRMRVDALLGVGFQAGGLSRSVPVFVFCDRSTRPAAEVVQNARKLAGLHRSGLLSEKWALPHGARSLLLILTEDPGRAAELQRLGKGLTVAPDSPVFTADRHTAESGLSRPCWRPVFQDGKPVYITEAIGPVLRAPGIAAGVDLHLPGAKSANDGEPGAIFASS